MRPARGRQHPRHSRHPQRGVHPRGARWGWIAVSPIEQTEPPSVPRPNPSPPTAEEAAAILTEAWKDPDWGVLIWFAMTTGARRGEVCGLRWSHLDLDLGVAKFQASIGQIAGCRWTLTWLKDRGRAAARVPLPTARPGSGRRGQR
jgi:integrase